MMITVEAIKDFPCFVGSDLKEYDGLKKGLKGDYPREIAKLLVKNKVAKFVEISITREKFLLEEFYEEMVFNMNKDKKGIPQDKYEKVRDKYAHLITELD